VPSHRRHDRLDAPQGYGVIAIRFVAVALLALMAAGDSPQSAQPTQATVLVVETERGAFAFQTFPGEAPRTVAHVIELARAGFYDGLRIHRSVPGFVVQFGDPQTRDPSNRSRWGRGPGASSGSPVGVSEITKKRKHLVGAVGIAHMGDPARADSQIYIALSARPDLDGLYTVFGQVVESEDVPARLQVGDLITRVFVRE
jgi:cyclophilin family peptidyl-prolyl cis-trans isomerase